jgi:predicted RNase H-related nuclease YkuK (DUF458 family)
MFNRKAVETSATHACDSAYGELKHHSATSEEYATIINKIQALEEIKAHADKSNRISPDTKALIAANLAGIVMVLGYEKANIITSKAFSMLLRAQ